MRKIEISLFFLVAVASVKSTCYAQPQIVLESTLTADQIIEKQIGKLSSENPLERKRAALKIGEYGQDAQSAIPFLIKLLNDSSYCPEPGVIYDHIPLVYESANWALIQIGTPCVKPLISVLASSDPLVRANSAYCLGKIADKRAVLPLIKLLNDNSFAKWQAIRALGEIKDKRATEPLLKLLNRGETRADIIYVLGEIGDAAAIDTLSFYLKDENVEVRIAVVSALGKIGHKRATAFLIDALSDNDSRVRNWAISALGKIGDPGAVDALINIVNNGQKEFKPRAIEALGQIGDAKATEALISFLGSNDASIRKNACLALYSIRGAGISFGEDSAKWKKWFEENRAKIESKKR